MLTKLLSPNDFNRFLLFAELLSISDKTLLWDGKNLEDITSSHGSEKISIEKGEAESKLLAEWHQSKTKESPPENLMESVFLHFLKDVPVRDHILNPEGTQWNAVFSSFHAIFKDRVHCQRQPDGSITLQIAKNKVMNGDTHNPHAIRIMLYELMLMALADGRISAIEYRFLEEFKQHYKVDDYAFDEIRERAESMYRETQKTIALVLE